MKLCKFTDRTNNTRILFLFYVHWKCRTITIICVNNYYKQSGYLQQLSRRLYVRVKGGLISQSCLPRQFWHITYNQEKKVIV